jgi:predicted ABC-type transport system involved in lysophospholipase L1 biosynthesis ATPase subunit
MNMNATLGRADSTGATESAPSSLATSPSPKALRCVKPIDRLPLLELVHATKTYSIQPPVTALHDVSLRITEGELMAIVGPSGSGKTTLLQIMGTLDRPTSGTVRVTGLDVADLADRQLAALRATRIGFVFQQFFLADHATAIDNVADGLLYAGIAFDERRQRALEALAQVGLADRATSRPNQLSGGQRQRAAIPPSCLPMSRPATSTAPREPRSSPSSSPSTNRGPPLQ